MYFVNNINRIKNHFLESGIKITNLKNIGMNLETRETLSYILTTHLSLKVLPESFLLLCHKIH